MDELRYAFIAVSAVIVVFIDWYVNLRGKE